MKRIPAMTLSALLALAPALAFANGAPARLPAPSPSAPPAPSARPLPGDSVFRLADAFSDQAGRPFTLAQRRGHAQLVAMFYSSCPYACPLLIESGKGVEHALSPAERAKLRVLYISLDPARDDTKALAAVVASHKVDGTRWTMARTDAAGVRRTAAVLGVRYRQLANGEFNHSSVLILLDADGRILARTEKLGPAPDPAFVAKVRAAIARG